MRAALSNGSPVRRLVFVATRYWPAIGGVESFIRHLARELGERHSVTVLAQRIDNGPTRRLTDTMLSAPTFEPFQDGPVQVFPLQVGAGRRLLLTPLAWQVVPGLRRHAYRRIRVASAFLYARVVAPSMSHHLRGADAVHVWGGDFLGWATVRAARLAAVPVVMTPFAHRGQYGDDPASARLYRRADRVLGLLETDADLYRELGVPAERVAVSGVCSPGLKTGGGDGLRARYGIAGPLILYLGVRRRYKGFHLLAQAAARVAKIRPDVTVAFVGPGPRLEGLDSSARILDVGAVDDVERAAWLNAADLLCLPSDGEILPGSILEAWSVGKPVLTSDIPALRELVGRAVGGITAEREPGALAEAILSLISQPARLRALGLAGRTHWRAYYSVDAVAGWHERLYSSLSRAEITQGAIRSPLHDVGAARSEAIDV